VAPLPAQVVRTTAKANNSSRTGAAGEECQEALLDVVQQGLRWCSNWSWEDIQKQPGKGDLWLRLERVAIMFELRRTTAATCRSTLPNSSATCANPGARIGFLIGLHTGHANHRIPPHCSSGVVSVALRQAPARQAAHSVLSCSAPGAGGGGAASSSFGGRRRLYRSSNQRIWTRITSS
jgi:hypothetical protein